MIIHTRLIFLGIQYWQQCEQRGQACKGFRSWQSMKERFRKKILPTIHITYKSILSEEELDNFEKHIKGIQVRIFVIGRKSFYVSIKDS